MSSTHLNFTHQTRSHPEIQNDTVSKAFNNHTPYDIGTGTPAEILRENELVREVLVLYFNNFSDIHFMFDQDTLLTDLVQGDAPKIILLAIMALGIKSVSITKMSSIQ